MPISSIAQILLRLFALNWLIVGLVEAASVAITVREHFAPQTLVTGIIYIAGGILVWLIAPKLSRILARGNDGDCSLMGLTEQKLYTAVFLGLGLYFALSAFAPAINWAHSFAVRRSLVEAMDDIELDLWGPPTYYELSETVITLAAGIVLVVASKTWARKLARDDEL